MSSDVDDIPAARRVGSKRIKRYHHKVRSGCRRCRERRVKCDEAKPICGSCRRLTVACTFDRAELSRRDSRAVQRQVINLDEMNTLYLWQTDGLLSTVSNLNTPQGHPEEQRFLEFYLTRTGSRFSSSASLDPFANVGQVFLILAPQISQSSQIVRNAISAAASAEENQMRHGNTSQWLIRRQKHYYHSTVTNILHANLSMEELLLCCALMFTYSCFSREFQAADLHLRSGLRLVEEQKRRSQAPILLTVEKALKDLEPILGLIFPGRVVPKAALAKPFVNEEKAHVQLRKVIKVMAEGRLDYLEGQYHHWNCKYEASHFEGSHSKLISQLYQLSTFVFRFITASKDSVVSETRRCVINDQIEYILAQNMACMVEDVSLLQEITAKRQPTMQH